MCVEVEARGGIFAISYKRLVRPSRRDRIFPSIGDNKKKTPLCYVFLFIELTLCTYSAVRIIDINNSPGHVRWNYR